MPHNITLSRQREKQQQQQQAHIIVIKLNSFMRETSQTISKCTKSLAQILIQNTQLRARLQSITTHQNYFSISII